jgi:hypothetical protein
LILAVKKIKKKNRDDSGKKDKNKKKDKKNDKEKVSLLQFR